MLNVFSLSLLVQVVPESGDGWHMFRVEKRRVGAPGGDLRPAGPLDYENPEHRRGFRFRVEVTDAVSILSSEVVSGEGVGDVMYTWPLGDVEKIREGRQQPNSVHRNVSTGEGWRGHWRDQFSGSVCS